MEAAHPAPRQTAHAAPRQTAHAAPPQTAHAMPPEAAHAVASSPRCAPTSRPRPTTASTRNAPSQRRRAPTPKPTPRRGRAPPCCPSCLPSADQQMRLVVLRAVVAARRHSPHPTATGRWKPYGRPHRSHRRRCHLLDGLGLHGLGLHVHAAPDRIPSQLCRLGRTRLSHTLEYRAIQYVARLAQLPRRLVARMQILTRARLTLAVQAAAGRADLRERLAAVL